MFSISPLTIFSAEEEGGFLSKLEMFKNVPGKFYSITTDVTSVIVTRKSTGISKRGREFK